MIHLVNPSFAARLYGLKGYEIVFICDDSGSMTAPIGESSWHLIVYFLVFQEKRIVHTENKEHAVRFQLKWLINVLVCYFQGMN